MESVNPNTALSRSNILYQEVETLIDGFFILKDGRLSPYYSSEKVRETTGNSVAEFYRRKVNE